MLFVFSHLLAVFAMVCVLYALGYLCFELHKSYLITTLPEKKLELGHNHPRGADVISDVEAVAQHDSTDSDDPSSEDKYTNEAIMVANIILQNSVPHKV